MNAAILIATIPAYVATIFLLVQFLDEKQKHFHLACKLCIGSMLWGLMVNMFYLGVNI